jgi:ABC-2 type transport system permease protein
MRTLIAFIKKDITEQLRSGKITFLLILFSLFGIMNPAIAKLTPWLLCTFSESFEGIGITITDVSISALDSWMQFFKNIPVALIAFVLMESNILTKEYESGTLILSLTKGLSRYKVIVAKSFTLLLLWSVGFFECYGITYAYNAFFWDNSVSQNLGFSAFCWWIFGIFAISLMILFSSFATSNAVVLVGTGAVTFGLYFVGLLDKVNKYLPTRLINGNSLVYGLEKAESYYFAIWLAVAIIVICFAISIHVFGKRQL